MRRELARKKLISCPFARRNGEWLQLRDLFFRLGDFVARAKHALAAPVCLRRNAGLRHRLAVEPCLIESASAWPVEVVDDPHPGRRRAYRVPPSLVPAG